MPPNTIEIPMEPGTNILTVSNRTKSQNFLPREENNILKICQSSLSLLAHILTGAIFAVALLFAFRNGLPLGGTPMHIVLCVTGYHLLMAQAILSLSPEGGWSSKLTLVQRRRAHWMLQITGSGLAITGTIVKILDKTVHFNTPHGIFGLIALIFTTICLINGLASLYAYKLRNILPGNISKVTHICFGIIAFGSASICLCLGIDKGLFRGWARASLADTFIAFVAILAAIIIFNPLISFFNKSKNMLKK